jgi:hypothetical protein
VSRRVRVWFWLGAIGVAFALLYATTPIVIAGFIERWLFVHGFEPIRVSVGLPYWRGFHVNEIRLRGSVGHRIFIVDSKAIDVEYRIAELFSGRFKRIHVTEATVEFLAADDAENTAQSSGENTSADSVMAGLLSGQWLADFPVDEFRLDRVTSSLHDTPEISTDLVLSASVTDAQLRLTGQLLLAELTGGAIELSVSANAVGEIRFALLASQGESTPLLEFTAVAATPRSSAGSFHGMLTVDLRFMSQLIETWSNLSHGISKPSGRLRSQWKMFLPETETNLLQHGTLMADTDISIQLEKINPSIQDLVLTVKSTISLQNGTLYWQLLDESVISASLALSESGKSKVPKPWKLTVNSEKLQGQLSFADYGWKLGVTRGAGVRIHSSKFNGFQVPETRLEFAKPTGLVYLAETHSWTLRPVTLTVSTNPLQWRDSSLSYDTLIVIVDQAESVDGSWRAKGQLSIAGLDGQIAGTPIPSAELSGMFQADNRQASISVDIKAAESALVVQANANHDFDKKRGSGEVKLKPMTFDGSKLILSRLTRSWPHAFDIHKGNVKLKADIDWRQRDPVHAPQEMEFSSKLHALGESIAGHFGDITFSGLNADIELENTTELRTPREVRLSIQHINVGTPISDFSAKFQLLSAVSSKQAVFAVSDLRADLLGGRARSEPFQFDVGRQANQFTIKLENIGLQNILDLERQEGLDGTGVLDGQLPFTITRQGLQLSNGRLTARPPGGKLVYSPSESVKSSAAGNASLDQLIKVLSNFQYDVLNINSNYSTTGDLTLRAELKGQNPDWQAGQPIHLNVNLEDNIPTLLRSLQMANELSKEITESIQRRYNPSH